MRTPRAVEAIVLLVFFVLLLALRIWEASTESWLLRDQIRDWGIALGAFRDLPLVGPATHVGGYTVGPAFYWILWAIRVVLGPWFDNLPHAGGIGQAILQTAADSLLFLAIWRRTKSPWAGLATAILVSTAAFDLSLSAIVWNPVMGSTLAKIAFALILLDWHHGSAVQAACAVAAAWSAVHAYTGAIFVAVGVFVTMVGEPFLRRDDRTLWRNAGIILFVVGALQLPYVLYQYERGFQSSGMGFVVEGVRRVLSGEAPPELEKSIAGYIGAVNGIQMVPWKSPLTGPFLLLCALIVVARYVRDLSLLAITFVPPVTAILGYSLFLAPLDDYYYLSLMAPAVLTAVLALTSVPWQAASRWVGIALVGVALAIIPARRSASQTMHHMPEYGAIVRASRLLVHRGVPLRQIRTAFRLPPTNDPEFVYRILGGKLDVASPWMAVILPDGRVEYRNLTES